MTGDFDTARDLQEKIFRKTNIVSDQNSLAVDLGSGQGIQALALCRTGFKVIAIDFNMQLIDELRNNSEGNDITIHEDNICNLKNYNYKPDVITCCGDTLAHLDTFDALETLIADCYSILNNHGKLFITFRDYSTEMKDVDRFIPVKQDATRILTCFLEYFSDYVRVTDLLYENINDTWQQKVSSYKKLRLSTRQMEQLLLETGFNIEYKETGRMNTLIGVKK